MGRSGNRYVIDENKSIRFYAVLPPPLDIIHFMHLHPIGIDTGGTFTDFIWLDADGRPRVHKQPSTPHDPSRAIVAGLAAAVAPPGAAVVHGSTVATNAL